jgi:hypothetical protein
MTNTIRTIDKYSHRKIRDKNSQCAFFLKRRFYTKTLQMNKPSNNEPEKCEITGKTNDYTSQTHHTTIN